jgi:hypothetical protein
MDQKGDGNGAAVEAHAINVSRVILLYDPVADALQIDGGNCSPDRVMDMCARCIRYMEDQRRLAVIAKMQEQVATQALASKLRQNLGRG